MFRLPDPFAVHEAMLTAINGMRTKFPDGQPTFHIDGVLHAVPAFIEKMEATNVPFAKIAMLQKQLAEAIAEAEAATPATMKFLRKFFLALAQYLPDDEDEHTWMKAFGGDSRPAPRKRTLAVRQRDAARKRRKRAEDKAKAAALAKARSGEDPPSSGPRSSQRGKARSRRSEPPVERSSIPAAPKTARSERGQPAAKRSNVRSAAATRRRG